MKPTFIALLALCLCLPLAGADKKKPLPKDLKSLEALAEKGDADAQNQLGYLYDRAAILATTEEVKKKLWTEAVKWFRKSAEQGDVKSQYELGRVYEYGLGVEKDPKEAVKWYRKAAEQQIKI
ncbi:MAG: tetratricopeptide repeat protein [Verrucomicrobiota bacterium]|nr:tetratricopeptide repeat protein [Verrucomicrobiota bacterium]